MGDRRVSDARDRLDSIPTILADRDVIEEYAALTAACRLNGHALQDKIHTADRRVAACAIAKGLPLFSRDGIYADAPRLRLV
ncbi:hypothetical protein GORHZ_181_00070 [Gordonia rhizosphera NBRC 16068]|uniref:PIN domain-containing protein n=1 Tax=Gordonia rhizosphera NBRC 16068 TaxID=1108045 RepID=K6W000_9ACTN|nr:hypothetical protein GORHZ_181_00070 [Gordonia rhizosphera NBRC 16068]